MCILCVFSVVCSMIKECMCVVCCVFYGERMYVCVFSVV